MKELSIIIPHFGVPDKLFRLLDSIKENNKTEIIVIDDNSSTEVFKDIKSKYPNIILIKNTRGKGAGGARNCGLEIAKGKFILFADSDDFFVEGYFSKIEKYLESDYDLVFFFSTSCIEGSSRLGERHLRYNGILNEYNNHYQKGVLFKFAVPWSKLIKKSLILKYKIKFQEIIASNDVLFSLKTSFHAENIKVSKQIIYTVTTSNNSLTRKLTKPIVRSRFNAAIDYNKFLESQEIHQYKMAMASHIYRAFKCGGSKFAYQILRESFQKNQPIFQSISHFISTLRHFKSGRYQHIK